jgi:hypothetical protein
VIIHDRKVFRPRRGPTKADTPLLVDANTVLTRSITSQLLQAIARRDSRIDQFLGSVENQEFSQSAFSVRVG